MIRITTRPLGDGAVLRLDGRDGWAAFELTRDQATALRDGLTRVLQPRDPCPTLAGMLAQFERSGE